jgi:uncharacterized protein (TIGR00255 family)
MTGYGRAHLQTEGVLLSIEILSVNRKHLDINVILPKHLNRFDPEIRKKVASAVSRGHITIRISVAFMRDAPLRVRPNLAMAKQLYQGWEEIAEALDLEKSHLSLSLLEKEPDLFIYEETEGMVMMGNLLFQGVDEALHPFLEMKSKEGELLKHDMLERIALLRSQSAQIASAAPAAQERFRKDLAQKVQEFLPLTEATDERIVREMILYATKTDITEEIVRFNSHLGQFKELLERGSEAVGKTLEFLVQELGRETNTMGSKSSSELSITNAVVKIKAELERIREQIQNIE